MSMTLEAVHCLDCKMPAWYGSEETDSVVSHCICEDKRVECDCCGHKFFRKDMSLDCMFLAYCKICNELEPYLMDNMAVARFKPRPGRAYSMLVAETIGDKLQLTMRAYHLGLSVVFPGMTKQEIVNRWMDSSMNQTAAETDLLFDAAFLRLIPDYFTPKEVALLRSDWVESKRAVVKGAG